MKCLYVSDAVVPTGFSRVTHNVVPHLIELGWDVPILGANYAGDPHAWEGKYKIYPALLGGDQMGIGRVNDLCKQLKPDVVLINNDPWNVRLMLAEVPPEIPTVAYMPVDAPNQRTARELNSLARAVAYTNYGRRELMLGGYNGRTEVIPHGVDTALYKPIGKEEARKRLRVKNPADDPRKWFIVGNVNRNQPRKRLDLTIMYFTEFWQSLGSPRHVKLYLHCANHDHGYDVLQLASYYGITEQLIFTNKNMTTVNNMHERDLHILYNMFDVQLTTTTGEGWGLTNHEGMACRVAQIMPEYSALGEWCSGAVRYVPVTSYEVTPNGINTIAGIPDREGTIEALRELYENEELRNKLADLAYERATLPEYQWASVAARFHAVLTEAATERQSRPVGVGGSHGKSAQTV